MYEHHSSQVLPFKHFLRRLFNHSGIALLVIALSLLIGILGYHVLAHLSWVDSLLNAAMILGGEGPVSPLDNTVAKVFASAYALYSGLVLLVCVGILFAPVMHRLLHSLHVREKN